MFVLAILPMSVTPTLGGLLLSYVTGAIEVLQVTVKNWIDIETKMNSVERLVEYGADLPQELPAELPDVDTRVSAASWPDKGQIEFEHVDFRYSDSLPLVLRDVSFTIRPGELIGVCGRTGSSKSTLIVALFRLRELAAGRILVDGEDIAALGLRLLRKRISIVPQSPTLFAGSLRFNLDPFGEATDKDMLHALSALGLDRSAVGDLDAHVEAGGTNFSVGQRQLLCIARALLTKSKVAVLDEPSSSVDNETDKAIQEAIRVHFSGSTVIVIAHRLDTLRDASRILVMDAGRVAEFDSPSALLANTGSVYSQLVMEERKTKGGATNLKSLSPEAEAGV